MSDAAEVIAEIDAALAQYAGTRSTLRAERDNARRLAATLRKARALIPQPPTDDEREALAGLVNDQHQCTRDWSDLRSRSGLERTNGDDYAIRTAYEAADAILTAGFRRRSIWSEPTQEGRDRVRALLGIDKEVS